MSTLSITLGSQNINNGITQDTGGDVDTIAVQVAGVEARQSGNGTALASADGNNSRILTFNSTSMTIRYLQVHPPGMCG